jgi:CRISPR-associated endonuclease/helicase Cas3
MMLDDKRLWAKSGESITNSMYLVGHLRDVHTAAGKVLVATEIDQLMALGLDSSHYLDRLRRCVLLAAALHDLGKANDHFQGMLLKKRQHLMQGLRHEWVTLLIVQQLKPWLMPAVGNSEMDWAIVEWAVTGHHPARSHDSPPRNCPANTGATELHLHLDMPDFMECLNWLQKTFNLHLPLPELRNDTVHLIGGNPVYGKLVRWAKDARKLWETFENNDRRFVAAVKLCLIASDIAGSALPPRHAENPQHWNWISKSFEHKPTDDNIQQIVSLRERTFEKGTDNNDREHFQTAVAESISPVTLVKAGCGCGKTQAAYRWAAKQHPTKRLYFCYPTTGTATEGFKDYLFSGELEVKTELFHSRRDIDYELLLNPKQDTDDVDALMRIESLEAWSTPIIACTVDTVLGIVQNNRRGVYAWPALAQSAFIFDEIHAYDDRLFGALLRFLLDLPGLPALLMTASLPAAREEALKQMLSKHRNLTLEVIHGPKSLEELSRYHKVTVESNDPLPLIQKTVKAGGKVLWVSNTVQRVMDSAEASEKAGLTPLIYHSRFKYEDRVQRHKAVVDAFDPKMKQGVLACTSQVCEMSLDLKGCTLLVTDNATVPALIQRLGRLNRQAKSGTPTCPFVVLTYDGNLPYSPADLKAATAWYEKLPATEITQDHLAKAWEQEAENLPELVPSAWLDGGPTTTVMELREGSPGITVIMESDVPKCTKPKEMGKFTMPMPPPPKQWNWKEWPRLNGVPIVKDELVQYDRMRGAAWQK